MKTMISKRILTLIILIPLVFIGCQRNDLKYASLQAKDILDKGEKKIITQSSANVYEKGKVKGVARTYNFSEVKSYLKENEKLLRAKYKTIKEYYYDKHVNEQDRSDALYVLAHINNTLLFMTESYIEDPCIYLKIIKNKNDFNVSQWVYDDYFSSSFKGTTLHYWTKLDNGKKRDLLISDLFVPNTVDRQDGTIGKCNQTIKDNNRAIEITPKDAVAYSKRGNMYYNLGNYNQAIVDLDKAIELNPKYEEAYVRRGDVYRSLGNYNQAIANYDKAIELNPKHAMCYYIRGAAYSYLGKYTQAIADYNKAIELNPQDADAYNNRGIDYGRLGNYKQATSDIKKAAVLCNKDAQYVLTKQNEK